jgi:hypothetical protein
MKNMVTMSVVGIVQGLLSVCVDSPQIMSKTTAFIFQNIKFWFILCRCRELKRVLYY